VGYSDYVDVEVEAILQATNKEKGAFLFRLPDQREVWVPYSVVADYEQYNRGDANLSVSVKEWFADQENLS
jgi:hypothetical protein